MGETYPFLYIEIKQQSSLQTSAMSYLSFIVGWVLIFNLINIFYMSISKRAYYENFFGSLCVYFIALIEKPIIYGIQFSSKYGLSVVELIYGMLVLFFIVRYILSNNSTVIFNTDWKSFCSQVHFSV